MRVVVRAQARVPLVQVVGTGGWQDRVFADIIAEYPGETKRVRVGFVDLGVNEDGSFYWNTVLNPDLKIENVVTGESEARSRIAEHEF